MLEVSHISKTFNAGTVNEKRAISDLSLRLADGEFATIVGSNGAGKSTLFNAIAGVFYVDAGTITLDGRDITFLPSYQRSRRIGHLFQDPLKGTAPHMTIEENLAVAYLRSSDRHVLFGRVTRKDRDFFRDALAQLDMGLEDRMNTPVGLLSGGQRQALTLLMATMVTPELLLLDEPAAGMNPTETAELLSCINTIRDTFHVAILLIEHDMSLVMRVCERIQVINFGQTIAAGLPEEIASNQEVIEAYLGEEEADDDAED